MENPKSLYQKLSDNGLYTKTYEDFVGQYGNPTGQKELYNKLSSNGLYTKSEQDFVGQYWAPEKKNSMASVGQQKAPTIPSVSPKTSSVTPSVSPAPTEDKLKTSNLGITGVDWAKNNKEEISVTDDLWNTIKGAGVKAFSTLASLPNKAQEAALNMFVSATGMASDFNKLPSADKKQIKNSLSSILRGGQQAGGTALVGQGRAIELSDKATQFLNKKSEDIYQKTRQEDVNVIDELDKFRQNPNAESIQKILYEGLKTTVESIPNMAIGAVSLPLLGVASAASKMEEQSKETGGNMGIGYLLNAGISGTAEAIFEGTTNKILKKASQAAFGNKAASKAVAEGFVKSVLKDMGEEGLSEGATTLVQDLSDKITNGEPIDYWKVAKNVANSAILGAMSGGGISGAGKGIGAARRYMAGKIMPKDQAEQIDKNINTIQDLNLERGDDVDPEVNKIISQKVNDLMQENQNIIAQNEEIASKLSADQVKQIFDIDDKLDENYNSAKSIINDPSMDDPAKELLLNDLLKKQNELKQQKDAIQKQTTSEVPVQPETGASVQVAQGEPKSKPQGPTEEVEAEEITPNWDMAGESDFLAGNNPEKAYTQRLLPEWNRESQLGNINPNSKITYGNPGGQFGGRINKEVVFAEDENGTTIGIIEIAENGGIEHLAVAPEFRNKGIATELYNRLKKDNPNLDLSKTSKRSVNFASWANKILQNEKVIDQVPTETITPAGPISPQQQTEQANAVQKGIDAVNKALTRGRPRKEAIQGGISFMQKTIAYEQADDITREQMVRDINKKFGVKEKKAPSVKKITAQPAPKKVTVQEMAALKDQIKLEIKAAKGGVKFADDLRKSISAKIKSFITRGKMSVSQQKSLLNGLKSNLLNPIMRERFFDRMQKMFDRIDYKDRLDEANTFRKKIKKLSKSDTLQDSVRIMASDFAKIIPDFTDIDEFLNKAREVYNAIKTPGVKKTELSLRQAAVIEDINAFTKSVLKSQDEKVKNTLLAEYDYLVDAGLIDTKMSLDEIQKYIMDIESGAQKSTPDKEAEIRERVGALFNSLAGIANSIIETGENPLTGEEVELDSYTKDLIKNFAKMDLSKLDIRDVYRATEALDNFLVNGIIDNMQAMYQKYDGALKIKELADEGIVAKNLKRFGLLGATNIWSRAWASNISPIKSVLDLMFRSREIGTKVFNASGLRDIANASSQAKNIVQKIDKAYQERFFKTKPNGEAFDSAKNNYERGIYAELKRSLIGTDEEIKADFYRRKKLIQDTINELEKSQDKKQIKKAEIYKKIFDPIKDAENIKEVEEKIDDINKDAVKWRIAIFEKYYPEVKQIAASVYNTILEDDTNYSPEISEKIIEDGEPDVDAKSSFKMAFDYLNTERAGTLMKNNRLKSLPKNRVLSFDFDYNNSSALGKMLTDIKTAPYVQKYKGFSNSKDFDKLFPDLKDRAIIKKRMNWYVNQVRNKNISISSENTRSAAKLIRALSRFGTSRALGSISSVVKQAVPALFNTAINLSNNPQALVKGLALMRDKDAQKFISNSGYGIANRALESQTAIESADEMLEKVDVNSIDKISKAIGDTGKVYLDTFLKTGDVAAARASWMAYYINKLDQIGENTSNIDWATHTLNKEAADYAEDQVNLQQNVSDTDMLGKLLNTKNPGVTIVRSMIIPFSSFIFNAKDKISTDLTILTSNANKQEKINAIKSLASTGTEMLVYEGISAWISSLIMSAAYAMLGYDEDEEEREDRKNRYINMAITRMITDGVSPFPNIGDKLSVGAINNILNYAQEDLDEEDRKLLYEYKPNDQTEMILGLIGGIPEIGAKAGLDIYDTGEMILSDVYYDKYGNEIVFSPEDKDKLKFVLASEILTLNKKYPLPSEVIRLNERLKSTIVKQNR